MQEFSTALGMKRVDGLYAEMQRVAPAMTDPDSFTTAARTLRSDPAIELTDEFTFAATNRSFHRYTGPISNAGAIIGRLFVIRGTTIERQAQAETRQARVEAERANHAKSEVLSRMSHELRTPLNAILGFAQLLDMDELPADSGERVTQIERAGRHLLALINEVLDISRIEAGQTELSPEPVQLAELLDETRPLVAGSAEKAGIDISVAVPGEHWACADRQRLKQVVLNLLSNAIKYNRPGGSVVVSSAVVDQALQIRVHDTGRGIPEGREADLFVPFNRLGADSGTTEGTGLGLSLSQALATAMGGRLTLEATSTEGTTLLLEIPATEPTTGDVGRDESRRDTEPVHAHSHPRPADCHTILYIEDNPANVNLLQDILRVRPNIVVVPSIQGSVGIDLARGGQPSLILLDLHLPDISGEEVLVRLKRDPETSAIPVVILTADAINAKPEHFLALGACDFLTKPVDVRRLMVVIDAILIEKEST